MINSRSPRDGRHPRAGFRCQQRRPCGSEAAEAVLPLVNRFAGCGQVHDCEPPRKATVRFRESTPYVLDGDKIRQGLNRDLGFSES